MRITLVLYVSALILVGCSKNSECTDESIPAIESTSDIKTISFKSLDGLMITANLYEASPDAPTIVLCHQARFNKFEYEGIADELMDMGYNCIAIDQRSGGPIANRQNETHLAAIKEKKPTDYLDAEQDIIAAVQYADKNYSGPLILWGSSYSSTLVLYVATANEEVDAVISFSPGNYFAPEKGDLTVLLSEYEKPMFLTSSKQEAPGVSELIKGKTLSDNQIQFIPEGEGHHGSRALWENQTGGEEYWNAVSAFLKKIKG